MKPVLAERESSLQCGKRDWLYDVILRSQVNRHIGYFVVDAENRHVREAVGCCCNCPPPTRPSSIRCCSGAVLSMKVVTDARAPHVR